MFMNIACPACGHRFRVPERSLGQQVVCPACTQAFQCGSVSPPSLTARPLASEKTSTVQERPQARPASIQPAPRIHYRCARCQKPLESPADQAGHKINCPDCGQRLQIPQASSTPSPSDNQTILAKEEAPAPPSLSRPCAPLLVRRPRKSRSLRRSRHRFLRRPLPCDGSIAWSAASRSLSGRAFRPAPIVGRSSARPAATAIIAITLIPSTIVNRLAPIGTHSWSPTSLARCADSNARRRNPPLDPTCAAPPVSRSSPSSQRLPRLCWRAPRPTLPPLSIGPSWPSRRQ